MFAAPSPTPYEEPAAKGDPDAQYTLARGLLDQRESAQSLLRGRALLLAAAEQGHFMAQSDLGVEGDTFNDEMGYLESSLTAVSIMLEYHAPHTGPDDKVGYGDL